MIKVTICCLRSDGRVFGGVLVLLRVTRSVASSARWPVDGTDLPQSDNISILSVGISWTLGIGNTFATCLIPSSLLTEVTCWVHVVVRLRAITSGAGIRRAITTTGEGCSYRNRKGKCQEEEFTISVVRFMTWWNIASSRTRYAISICINLLWKYQLDIK